MFAANYGIKTGFRHTSFENKKVEVMKLCLAIILIFSCSIIHSKPIPKAILSLETGSGRGFIAMQQTGESGKAGFQYLDAGHYQLLVEFPQQDGKYLKEKPKHTTLTKVTYNGKKRIYYYQGTEGYFSVKLSRLKRIEKESLQAVFRERYTENRVQILMAQFQARRSGAAIAIQVEAITAAQFKKATDKLGSDISTISIQGVK